MNNPATDNTPFAHILQSVLRQECGYSNHPADPGGETKYGISKRYHPAIDILNLTVEEAALIYKADFWDALHFPDLTFEPVQLHLFHIAVLHGHAAALDTARTSLQLLWQPARGRRNKSFCGELACKLNGAAAAHRCNLSQTINYLWNDRIRTLLYQSPQTACFANGWFARINTVYDEVNQLWRLS